MYLVQVMRWLTAKLWYKYCSHLFCFTCAVLVSGIGNYVWYNGLLLTLFTFYFGRAELMKSGCPGVLSLVSLGQWSQIYTPSLKSSDIRHWTQVASYSVHWTHQSDSPAAAGHLASTSQVKYVGGVEFFLPSSQWRHWFLQKV